MSIAPVFLLVLNRHGASGLAVTEFTQSLDTNLISSGTFDSAAPWTNEDAVHWSISGGVLTGTPVQTGAVYQGIDITSGVWYQVEFDAVVTSGSIAAQLSATGVGLGQVHTVSGSFQEAIRFPGGAPILVFLYPVGGFGGTIDNAVVQRIIREDVWEMPNASGTHTLTFTLPESPLAGQRIELWYRYQDSANYWSAALIRSADNSQWNFQLNSVSSGTATNRISSTNVGTVDSLRVITSGNNHMAYTGSSGTYTKRNGTIGSSTFASETGITILYTSAFTPTLVTSI